MKRFYKRILVYVAVACIALLAVPHVAEAAVRSASADGEATIYLTGNFSVDFDVVYRAVLSPGPQNKSWSTLSILLLGTQLPGPGASVGLANGGLGQKTQPFTNITYPNFRNDFQEHRVSCGNGCVIELRGDAAHIYAYVNGLELASWYRSDLYLQHPYIQLNAEAHGAGDSLSASLTPIRVIAAGRALSHPKCAFTTRGIEPSGLGTLTFRGVSGNARAAFVRLSSGVHGEKC